MKGVLTFGEDPCGEAIEGREGGRREEEGRRGGKESGAERKTEPSPRGEGKTSKR